MTASAGSSLLIRESFGANNAALRPSRKPIGTLQSLCQPEKGAKATAAATKHPNMAANPIYAVF
jgi:hypothetical protein